MIWSFTFVVFFGLADVLWKGVMQRMDMWWGLVFRSVMSTVLLVIVSLLMESPLEGIRVAFGSGLAWNWTLALVAGVVAYVFFSQALKEAPIHVVIPLVNLNGLSIWCWDMVLSDAPMVVTPRHGVAVLLAAVGAAYLGWGSADEEVRRRNGRGVLLGLGAVVAWGRGYAEYPVCLEAMGPMTLGWSVELAILLGAMVVLAFNGSRRRSVELNGFGLPMVVGALIALAVASMNVAFTELPATSVAMWSMFTPVMAILIAAVLHGQRISVGEACAVVAVGMAQWLYFSTA